MVLRFPTNKNRGSSIVGVTASVFIALVIFIALGQRVNQATRGSKAVRVKGEIETLQDSLELVFNDPQICKSALKNAAFPSGLPAKFSPGGTLSSLQLTRAIALENRNIITNGVPFSSAYPGVNITLIEENPANRSFPSPSETTYEAILKVDLAPSINAGLQARSLTFPLSVTTDTLIDGVKDHEVKGCNARTPTSLTLPLRSLRETLSNPSLCAASMKNSVVPTPGTAKFNPTGSLPSNQILAAVSSGVTPLLKVGVPYGTNHTISSLSLQEPDATTRKTLPPSQTRYISSISLELIPLANPTLRETRTIPIWVTTDTDPLNTIPDHEIQECGLIEFGSANFSTTGTFTWKVPEGIQTIIVETWGAGGGGGGARWHTTLLDSCGGGGGGGGGYSKATLSVTPGSLYALTIGAGGIGGAAGSGANQSTGNAGNGTAGSPTTFGTGLSIEGGRGGLGCAYNSTTTRYVPGEGAVGGCSGNTVCQCSNCATQNVIPGGRGAYGKFNSYSYKNSFGGAGGNSPKGGSGAQHNTFASSSGQPGKFPGGGGGGGSRYNDTIGARPGSNGAAGRILISW